MTEKYKLGDRVDNPGGYSYYIGRFKRKDHGVRCLSSLIPWSFCVGSFVDLIGDPPKGVFHLWLTADFVHSGRLQFFDLTGGLAMACVKDGGWEVLTAVQTKILRSFNPERGTPYGRWWVEMEEIK